MTVPSARRTDPPSRPSEAGMTVVEVLVAITILSLGLLASFQVFDAASRGAYRAEQKQVALDRAQRELEELRALEYDQLALTAMPPSSTDPRLPSSRVSGSSFNLNRSGTADNATLVVNGGSRYPTGTIAGGVVAPGPEPFTSGDVRGNIYRYIVWRNDPTCGVCPGTQDLKRIVVVVKLESTAIAPDRAYVEVQSDFIDPTESIATNVPPPGGGEITAEQFWLTDTPCAAGGSTTRVEPTSDHPLHNTLGQCSSGLQTGAVPGAPDALLRAAPADTAPADPSLPGVFDYSNDPALEPTPNTDKGVQILEGSTSGCSFTPSGTNPHQKVHRWVSDPLPQSFAMSGRAVLEFSTRAINDANHKGTLCVFLFTRSAGVDTPIINQATFQNFFRYTPPSGGWWPRLAWETIRFDMNFAGITAPAGHRIGLAIAVERQTTTTGAPIQILYDHHLYPSRLEIDTSTPL